MVNRLVIATLLACEMTILFPHCADAAQRIEQTHPQTRVIESNEQLYRDFMLSLLSRHVQKAIHNFYGEPRPFELFSAKILELKRLQSGSFWFEITVQVRTFVGAHNPPYGIETITLTNYSKDGQIKVVKYVHQDDPIAFDSSIPVPAVPPAINSDTPSNFKLGADIGAQRVLEQWVHYVSTKQYNAATGLFTPETSDQELPEHWTYLQNIKKVSLQQYKDITANFGGIPMDLSKFYAVKVYIAVIDYDVHDENRAGVMVGKKLHRVFVVKKKASDPWRIFMMQGYTTFGALKSWGLDLQGVTNYGDLYHLEKGR